MAIKSTAKYKCVTVWAQLCKKSSQRGELFVITILFDFAFEPNSTRRYLVLLTAMHSA